jgi:hypothetical protein
MTGKPVEMPGHASSSARAVLVLGMHRSGTSAVTAALQALGVYLGDRTMQGNEFNPKGFYEDIDLAAVNNRLLADAGRAWDSFLLPDFRAEYAESYVRELKSARDIVSSRFGGHPLWAFKDPRTSRLLSFWLDVLRTEGCQPVLVATLRHPGSVADSLGARDRMPRVKALALWLFHQAESLDAVTRLGGVVVDYDDLIADPETALVSLAKFLGVAIRHDSEDVQAFANAFLSPGLRHSFYGFSEQGVEHDELGRLCWRLYLHMKSRSAVKESEQAASALLADIAEYRERMADWLACVDAYTDRERLCIEGEMHLHALIAVKDRELDVRHNEISRLNDIVRDKDRELGERHNEISRLNDIVRDKDRELGERHNEISRLNDIVRDKDRELGERHNEISRLNCALSEREQELSSQTKYFLALRKQQTATTQTLAETQQELAAFRGILYRKVFTPHPDMAMAGDKPPADGVIGVPEA